MPAEQCDVLLVEDNPADARLLQEEMKDTTTNFRVSAVCQSLAEALELLAKRQFAAVLLDLTLPDSRGVKTVAHMHDAAPGLPIIVLTGLSDEDVGLEAVRKGAQDYLVKGHTNGNLLCRALKYAIQRKEFQAALLESEEQLRRMNETLEVRVAERTVEAERRAEQLRALTTELTQAEKRERQRLAQVLHDGLQQLLAGAKFSVGMLGVKAVNDDQKPLLAELDDILDQAIQASRSLCMELSPPVLYNGTFTEALDWLSHQFRQKYGLNVWVHADEEMDIPVEDVRILAFEAVRELLFNVVKHAGVKSADVYLRCLPDRSLEIDVHDNGKGFDPVQAKNSDDLGGSFGLFSIKERLKYIGGHFDIVSAPGEGTDMIIQLPPHIYLGQEINDTIDRERQVYDGMSGCTPAAVHDSGSKIQILLVDDHEMMRKGLADLLEDQPDFTIVAEANDGEAAVQLARKVEPDVIIMDVNMPRMNGIDATRIIHHEMPCIKIIALSMYEEADMAAAMREAGAVNYLHKAGSYDTLIAAIHSCINGKNLQHSDPVS